MKITQKELAEILAIIKKNEECQNADDIIREYKDWSSSDDGSSFTYSENEMVCDINVDDITGEGTLFVELADPASQT